MQVVAMLLARILNPPMPQIKDSDEDDLGRELSVEDPFVGIVTNMGSQDNFQWSEPRFKVDIPKLQGSAKFQVGTR